MKQLKTVILLVLSAVFSFNVWAGCCGGSRREPPRHNTTSSGNEISGRLRRLQEDADDLTRRLVRTDMDSRHGMTLRHRREKLSLDIIHEAQRILFDQKNPRDDRRTRQIIELLRNEAAYLQEELKDDASDFPYLEHLGDVAALIRDIRAGKITYSQRVPRNEDILLREIQEMQRKALEEIHRRHMRER